MKVMSSGNFIWRWPARGLDRLNVRVVAWRLAQDPGRNRAVPAGTDLARAELAPEPHGATSLAGLRGELWSSERGDWVATRLPGREGNRGAAALVLLHGWLATPAHLHYLAWRLRPLIREGVDIWFPRLPAHMERTPTGAVSGSRCLVSDPVVSAASVRQAASETNELGAWLRRRHDRVSLWGVSLGGWVAGVAAAKSEGVWRQLLLWSPVVDPIATMAQSPIAAAAGGSRTPADLESMRAELHDVIPMDTPLIDRELRVAVVSGRYDNVAFARSVRLLASRWGAELSLLPHGHISIMLSLPAWRAARFFISQSQS